MSTSLHFNCLLKVAKLYDMKPAVGGVNKTVFALCLHKATKNYINDQEDSPCFLFNYFIYLRLKQFRKISN